MEDISQEESAPELKKEGSLLKKLIIAVPLFIVQLVAVYFITANFLVSGTHSPAGFTPSGTTNTAQSENDALTNPDAGRFVYPLDDIIVNPAETDGKRLLLVSLGLDLNSKQQRDILREREVIIKDRVISVLSSKRIEELNRAGNKDSLRVELTEELNKMQLGGKISRIYFSKFIIQ